MFQQKKITYVVKIYNRFIKMWLWAEQKKLSSFLPDTTGVFVNLHSEVVARRSSVKKMFLKNSQKLQENTWVGVSFLKNVAGFRLLTLFKKRIHLGFYGVFVNSFIYRTNMVSASVHSFYPNLLPHPWAFSESNVI